MFFLLLTLISHLQAREALTVWTAWLKCKSIEQQLLREHPRTSPRQSLEIQSQLMMRTGRLSLALILCEPTAAAVASCEICVELEMCLKWHAIPSERPRLPELYRVLSVHFASRRVLDADRCTPPHFVTSDIFVDAPKLLSGLWQITRDRTRLFNYDNWAKPPANFDRIFPQSESGSSPYHALVLSVAAPASAHTGTRTPSCLGPNTSCVAATYAARSRDRAS